MVKWTPTGMVVVASSEPLSHLVVTTTADLGGRYLLDKFWVARQQLPNIHVAAMHMSTV